MSFIEEILAAHGGDKREAAATLAHGLMVGDRSQLKLGYSRASALRTAQEMYELDEAEMDHVDALLSRRLLVEPVEYGPDEDVLRVRREQSNGGSAS